MKLLKQLKKEDWDRIEAKCSMNQAEEETIINQHGPRGLEKEIIFRELGELVNAKIDISHIYKTNISSQFEDPIFEIVRSFISIYKPKEEIQYHTVLKMINIKLKKVGYGNISPFRFSRYLKSLGFIDGTHKYKDTNPNKRTLWLKIPRKLKGV